MNFRPNFINSKEDKIGMDYLSSGANEPITKYMSVDLVTFTEHQSITEAIDLLLKHRISGAPVLDSKNNLIGILSEKDCLQVILNRVYSGHHVSKVQVGDLMSRELVTVDVYKTVVEVAQLFISSHYRRFPVIDGKGKLVGQVSRKDILKVTRDLKSTTW